MQCSLDQVFCYKVCEIKGSSEFKIIEIMCMINVNLLWEKICLQIVFKSFFAISQSENYFAEDYDIWKEW